MEADYIKLNAEHKKMVARRQVMQAKLKQVSWRIYEDQQNISLILFQLYVKRNQRNTYRDPYDQNSTGSTNSNSFQYTPNCSSLSSNVNIYFNKLNSVLMILTLISSLQDLDIFLILNHQ